MKKFLFFVFFLFFMGIGVINSVSAQPTAEDGLFGQYFSRMVKSCSEGSGHSVVSGFQRTPF